MILSVDIAAGFTLNVLPGMFDPVVPNEGDKWSLQDDDWKKKKWTL